jgi:hypothetical protein
MFVEPQTPFCKVTPAGELKAARFAVPENEFTLVSVTLVEVPLVAPMLKSNGPAVETVKSDTTNFTVIEWDKDPLEAVTVRV